MPLQALPHARIARTYNRSQVRGGRVEVESSVGKGSVFSVYLPG